MSRDVNYLTLRRLYDRLNTLERIQEHSQACDLVNLSISHSLQTLCIPEVFEAVVAAGLRLNGRIDHVFRMRFPSTTLSRRALPAPRPIANRSINPSRVTNTDAEDTSSSGYWPARQPKWTPRVTRITHVKVTFDIDRKCDHVKLFSLHWRKISLHNTDT